MLCNWNITFKVRFYSPRDGKQSRLTMLRLESCKTAKNLHSYFFRFISPWRNLIKRIKSCEFFFIYSLHVPLITSIEISKKIHFNQNSFRAKNSVWLSTAIVRPIEADCYMWLLRNAIVNTFIMCDLVCGSFICGF